MTDQITFRDKTYGVGDVVTVLATLEAADDLGGAMELIQSLPAAGPLRPKAAYALGQFLSHGLPRHVEFASRLISDVEGVPLADQLAALRRDDLPPEEKNRLSIGANIAREVFAGRAPYDDWLRTQAGVGEYDSTLIPLFLVRDRAWALEHLPTVFDGDTVAASIGLRGALAELDDAGKATLAREVRARYAGLPEATRAKLECDFKDAGL